MPNETNAGEPVKVGPVVVLEPSAVEQPGDGAVGGDPDVTFGGSPDVGSGSGFLDEDAGPEDVAVQGNNSSPGTPSVGDTGEIVKYEYRCKICQLSHRMPGLYKLLHELILRDKMSYQGAMNEANTYIKQHGLDLKLLNMVNMSGHFGKHINIKQQVALAVSRTQMAPPPPPSGAIQSQQQVTAIAIKSAESDMDDFKNLDDLRKRLTGILYKLENQLEAQDPKDNNRLKLDRWAVQLYTSLVSEARACIGDLNKMRASERLINTVIQQFLDKMTFSIIPQLLEEYEIIVKELRHAGVPERTVQMIDERLRLKTATIIAHTARAAIVEVQRQFKLR